MLRRRPLLSCSSLVYPACPDPVGERLSRRANHLPAVAATSRSPAFATCAPRFHLSAFLSSSCALFCAMGAPQLLLFQSLPHSFHRNGGVGDSIGMPNQKNSRLSSLESIRPPMLSPTPPLRWKEIGRAHV